MTNAITRRGAIKAGAALSLTASVAQAAESPNAKRPAMTDKIDTHHHFLPKVYVDAAGLEHLASATPNKAAPQSTALEQSRQRLSALRRTSGVVANGPNVTFLPDNCRSVIGG